MKTDMKKQCLEEPNPIKIGFHVLGNNNLYLYKRCYMQDWNLPPFLTLLSRLRHSVTVGRSLPQLLTTHFSQTEPYEMGQCVVLMRKKRNA